MDNTKDEKTNGEHKGGVISRSQLYSIASAHSREAIDVLVDLMINCRVPSIKLGAAKAILDKCLPDLKATEVTGDQGGEVLIRLIPEAAFKKDGNTGLANKELSSPTNDL